MQGFNAYVDERRTRVQRALATALPSPPTCPAILHEALTYSLDAGGKRLRPVLTLLSAEAVSTRDADIALAEPAACAIELIHTYSLIHDDLPAMDNDSLRRGRPTSHVVFGDGLAILAGDGLLTEAFSLLARLPRSDAAAIGDRKLQAIAVVADAAGACGMVGGQAIDLAAANQVPARPGRPSPRPLDPAGLADMHARKTGALIRAAAQVGAIMAGGDPNQVAAIVRYASALGLAFQIIDDVLDVEGETTSLGKSAGKDAAAGKPTYPAFYGIHESKQRAHQARDAAIAALDTAPLHRPAPLRALAEWAVSRTS